MATEKDAGRDKRLVLGLVAVAVGAAVGAVYLGYTWLHSAQPTPSKIDVSNVANASHRTAPETPAYRNLLSEYNNDGAQRAQKDNQSFIASIAVGNSTPVNAPPQTKPPRTHTAAPQTAKANTASQKGDGLSEAQRTALKRVMGQITDDGTPPEQTALLGVSTEPGAEEGKGNGSKTPSAFAGWASSVVPQTAAYGLGGAATSAPAIELIPAFTRATGSITIGVDSDNSGTPVIGTIWSGPYSGATFKAPRSQLAGDGVVLHFTTMYWNHKTYTVDAYALKDTTLMANVATDVNHRYWSRILLPAIASGIGKAGQLYQDANTDILTNGYSTVTSHASMPNGTAVTGVIAGGTAAEAANVLKQDAAKLPATQVTVDAGQPVYIQFMASVTTADEVKPRGDGAATTTTTSTQSQQPVKPTLAELRAQTRERIDSQLPSQPDANAPE